MSDSALTILATPKPFRGHFSLIQHNAIRSWQQLRPRPEIYLFGEEEGTADAATELHVHHLPAIKSNEFGTPLLNDLLQRARNVPGSSPLCYVNCDIILLQEFLDAVATVAHKFPKFLCVAQRLNVDLATGLRFEPGWQSRFRNQTGSHGSLGGPLAIDVFAFARDVYTEVPPLTLGRAWFDQWLIKDARVRHIPVVDVSRVAQAIHQNHDYAHIDGGQQAAYWGEEARRNLAIYGGTPHAYTLLDVTHELTESREIRRVRFRRQAAALRDLVWKAAIAPTAGVRRKLGLHRKQEIQADRTAKA